MKILHIVEGSVGNRAYKEAYALKQKGIVNEVLCTMEGDPTFTYNSFDEVTLSTPKEFPEKVIDSDADIILMHDRPETMSFVTERIKKYKDSRPIVYECYDLWYNLGKKWETFNHDEHYMLATADLVVHMGYLNQNRSHEIYPYKTDEIIVMSMTPRDFIPEQSKDHIGDIVYEGGVSHHMSMNTKMENQRKFRDMHDAYWGFRKHGYGFDIYAAYDKLVDYPTILGLRFPELMSKLTEYDWGFLGNTFETPLLSVAGPCKVWEYSMAGLPIIAMNVDDVVDQTNKGGIIKCHSVEEAVEIMHSVDREALAKESFETCRYLDDEIDILIDTCKTLIGE